jgi:hypothetical protein
LQWKHTGMGKRDEARGNFKDRSEEDGVLILKE